MSNFVKNSILIGTVLIASGVLAGSAFAAGPGGSPGQQALQNKINAAFTKMGDDTVEALSQDVVVITAQGTLDSCVNNGCPQSMQDTFQQSVNQAQAEDDRDWGAVDDDQDQIDSLQQQMWDRYGVSIGDDG